MRRRNEDIDQIIIKRRSKRAHAEEHSGAWKVAFADFALAMMALFMVLWIIQPRADAQRLKQSGVSDSLLMMEGGSGIFDGISQRPTDAGAMPESEEAKARRQQNLVHQGEGVVAQRYDTQVELQELAKLMSLLAERADAVANLEVHVVPQGLRVLDRFNPLSGQARL
ncbi:flagellar motor protein MotB [Pseudomonas chlororaphis subsp. aurantiaca]|uniref:flagellar motor protein MotB n=1 Tax=Pseudomonas chlororaphis TaxID=587753 RepID=UPI0027DD0D69|nr:flagellar motor protein MotB [Pseudomonas chlororaphis]WMI97611.1 flagellar motor protein MotB [Pseudomonas chlororaphis subsp. aurantiaca]